MQLTLGTKLSLHSFKEEDIANIANNFGDKITDIHFSHYNPLEIATGRGCVLTENLKDDTLRLCETLSKYNIAPTLLINNLQHNDYAKVVKILKDVYIPRGLKGVVLRDMELARMIREENLPLNLQGSCISYKLTAEELQEEKDLGFTVHNPIVDIIRDTENLKRNHELGFKSKILISEGCLNKCPFEKEHRWIVGQNRRFGLNGEITCQHLVEKDLRYFLKSNWITIGRYKELEEYIDIVKIPRGTVLNDELSWIENGLERIFDIYENDKEYNVLDYMSSAYLSPMKKKYGYISSKIFDDGIFFDHIEKCNNPSCEYCNGKIKEIERLAK